MISARLLFFLSAIVAPKSVPFASAAPPDTGQDWISIEDGIEFQPASGHGMDRELALSMARERFLRQSNQDFSYLYVDAQETYYMPWSQGWRYVGFYTDCHEKRMKYDEDAEDQDEEIEKEPCWRYLLWAAYIDLDYQNLGVGEYQFFDTYTREWDASACKYINNGITENEDGTIEVDETKCKKMDCHLPHSKNWHLLGFFKEYEYTGWFEQLFKHEGYCIWKNGEAEFMYENYASWPEGCTKSETYTKDGTLLYYDLKVTVNATMGYGLYTDARCSKDYQGTEVTVDQVIDDDLLSQDELDYWNEAMEIYKVCQPCRAYTILPGGKSNKNRGLVASDGGDEDEEERQLKYQDPNNGNFQCTDMAGYTNVNQCMKFKTKTLLEPASIEEVLDAATQDGITQVTVAGRTYGSYNAGLDEKLLRPNWFLLIIAMAVFGAGFFFLAASVCWSYRQWHYHVPGANLKQPLINDDTMAKYVPAPEPDEKTVGSDESDKQSSSLESQNSPNRPKSDNSLRSQNSPKSDKSLKSQNSPKSDKSLRGQNSQGQQQPPPHQEQPQQEVAESNMDNDNKIKKSASLVSLYDL